MHVPVLKQYWHHFWMQCHDNMVVKSMAEKHGSQHVSRNGFSNHDMHQHDLYQLLLFTLHPIEVKVSLSWCMNAAGTICDNWCPGSLKKICPLRRTLGWTGWQHEKPPFHQQTSDTEMICWHPKNTHRDSWWFKTSEKNYTIVYLKMRPAPIIRYCSSARPVPGRKLRKNQTTIRNQWSKRNLN